MEEYFWVKIRSCFPTVVGPPAGAHQRLGQKEAPALSSTSCFLQPDAGIPLCVSSEEGAWLHHQE